MDRPSPAVRGLSRIGLMLAAMVGAATPPDSPFGYRPPTVQQQQRRRHKPPKQTSHSGLGRFLSWSVLEKMGWTKNGRGDMLNPQREARRSAARAVYEHTGRRLSGRQWKRLRRGH